jgi:hypothetical protein
MRWRIQELPWWLAMCYQHRLLWGNEAGWNSQAECWWGAARTVYYTRTKLACRHVPGADFEPTIWLSLYILQPRAVCVPNPGQYFFTFQEMVLNPHPAVCKTCTDPHPFLCYILVYEFWVRILHLVWSTAIRVRRFYGYYAVQCSKMLVMRWHRCVFRWRIL